MTVRKIHTSHIRAGSISIFEQMWLEFVTVLHRLQSHRLTMACMLQVLVTTLDDEMEIVGIDRIDVSKIDAE